MSGKLIIAAMSLTLLGTATAQAENFLAPRDSVVGSPTADIPPPVNHFVAAPPTPDPATLGLGGSGDPVSTLTQHTISAGSAASGANGLVSSSPSPDGNQSAFYNTAEEGSVNASGYENQSFISSNTGESGVLSSAESMVSRMQAHTTMTPAEETGIFNGATYSGRAGMDSAAAGVSTEPIIGSD